MRKSFVLVHERPVWNAGGKCGERSVKAILIDRGLLPAVAVSVTQFHDQRAVDDLNAAGIGEAGHA